MEPVVGKRARILPVVAMVCVSATVIGLGAGYLLGPPAGVILALSVAGLFAWISIADDLLHLDARAVQVGVSVFLFGGVTVALVVALHSAVALVTGAIFTAIAAVWSMASPDSVGEDL